MTRAVIIVCRACKGWGQVGFWRRRKCHSCEGMGFWQERPEPRVVDAPGPDGVYKPA